MLHDSHLVSCATRLARYMGPHLSMLGPYLSIHIERTLPSVRVRSIHSMLPSSFFERSTWYGVGLGLGLGLGLG